MFCINCFNLTEYYSTTYLFSLSYTAYCLTIVIGSSSVSSLMEIDYIFILLPISNCYFLSIEIITQSLLCGDRYLYLSLYTAYLLPIAIHPYKLVQCTVFARLKINFKFISYCSLRLLFIVILIFALVFSFRLQTWCEYYLNICSARHCS